MYVYHIWFFSYIHINYTIQPKAFADQFSKFFFLPALIHSFSLVRKIVILMLYILSCSCPYPIYNATKNICRSRFPTSIFTRPWMCTKCFIQAAWMIFPSYRHLFSDLGWEFVYIQRLSYHWNQPDPMKPLLRSTLSSSFANTRSTASRFYISHIKCI